MKEDSYLLGLIEDKISQCENKYMVTATGFLDAHQQSAARLFCRKNHIPIFDREEEQKAVESGNLPAVRAMFYGGYDEAERVVLAVLPDYAFSAEEEHLTVIRAKQPTGSKALTHRDYLGSLLGLGLKRELIGDILVRKDGADIIVLAEIAEFILMQYGKAGRVNLSLTAHPACELIVPQPERRRITDTVASLRLDSVTASAFGLSRGKAAQGIARGVVFVNYIEVNKPDFQLAEGDKITLRGKGKVCLVEVGGKSRKDRQYITLEKY